MQNTIQKKAPISGENKKTASELYREQTAADILKILDGRFHHAHAPLTQTQIKAFHAIELKELSIFLSGDAMQRNEHLKRPECPLKNPRQHSLARYDYKKGMQDYIASFGYTLPEFACNYGTSFLEALANYCEYKAGDEKQARVLPFKRKKK